MTAPFSNSIILWLDKYIGNPCEYQHLKAKFLRNIDPTHPEPRNFESSNMIRTFFDDSSSLVPCRIGAPCELITSTDAGQCADYIRSSLEANKRIYLIISDYIARDLLPHIFTAHKDALREGSLSIYVLVFKWNSSGNYMDWLRDHVENILVFNHEFDLLYRLGRDIARYFVDIGRLFLEQGTIPNNHRALTYFEWATFLLRRAEKIAIYRDFKPIRDVENLIQQAKEIISNETALVNQIYYSRVALEESLNNSLFIYESKGCHNQASELSSMLHKLTDEPVVVFDDSDAFLTRLQKQSCSIHHYSPILASPHISDLTEILEELSPIASVDYIYIYNPNVVRSVTFDDRNLIHRFPKVRNLYSLARVVALEWTSERASTCDRIGDVCTEHADSDLARMYYAKAIKLNDNLSAFITKK